MLVRVLAQGSALAQARVRVPLRPEQARASAQVPPQAQGPEQGREQALESALASPQEPERAPVSEQVSLQALERALAPVSEQASPEVAEPVRVSAWARALPREVERLPAPRRPLQQTTLQAARRSAGAKAFHAFSDSRVGYSLR